MPKTKRKLMGGGLFDAIFGSKYKPTDFKNKTVEDVLKMKLPFSITADFFDTVGEAEIPTEVQEAIQFMVDLNDRKKVFEKCYKNKMVKPTHSAIRPKPAPVPAVEEKKSEPAAAPEEQEENPEPPKEEEEVVEKKEEKKEPPPFMDGGRRRRRSTKKHRKHRRSKKSYKKYKKI